MFFWVFIIAVYAFFMQLHMDESVKLYCVQPGPPEQVRVALRGPDAVTISWKTHGMYYDIGIFRYYVDDTPNPTVEYSIYSNFSISYNASGTSTNYEATKDGSWFHNCDFNVSNSTVYYYRIPLSECVTLLEQYLFTSQPSFGDRSPINISIVGDIGYDTDENQDAPTKTVRALTEAVKNTNLFLHVGDISYADDDFFFPSITYEEKWNQFQQRMQEVTANNFYMTLPGNHEVTCRINDDAFCKKTEDRSRYRNFTAYLHRFRMPGNESGGYENLWYSFNYGLAHFVIISTETDFPNAPSGPGTNENGGDFAPNGTQLEWLQADLQAANETRTEVPWIIVAGHRPFFGSVPEYSKDPFEHSDNCNACRKAFADIIFNNSVDFYFSGHVHWYERLYPVDSNGNYSATNYINQTGPIYVTTGAGGAPEKKQVLNVQNITANASALIISSYGYTRLEIKNFTHCQLSFYDVLNNSKIDPVDIVRKR